MQTHGAITVNEPIKSVSAVKRYPRARKKRGGETIIWQRIKSMSEEALKFHKISPELASALGRMFIHNHLTPRQADAGRRYAYIMARFEKYCVEGRRNAKSPSYERAYGTDQELERLAQDPDGLDRYEKRAREARKDYDRLMKVVGRYAGAKDVLDNLCCSDIEPPEGWRSNTAMVLAAIDKEFGEQDNSPEARRRRQIARGSLKKENGLK